MTSYDWAQLMRGTRYHEAGHAVAAYYHGYTVTCVAATDKGWMAYYRPLRLGGWSELWREACVTMAGPLSDQRASWGEIRPQPWAEFLTEAEAALEEIDYNDEMRSDDADLLQLIRQMGDDPQESYWIVVEDAQQLVSDHWTEIEAVALALEQNNILDGQEFVQLITKGG